VAGGRIARSFESETVLSHAVRAWSESSFLASPDSSSLQHRNATPSAVRSSAPRRDLPKLIIANLRSSSFHGGPEHQILGLGRALSQTDEVVSILFSEGGRSRPFMERCLQNGIDVVELKHRNSHIMAMVRELADALRDRSADVLLCHGYKADLIGFLAARRVGIPVVAVAHGWTSENTKVRFYEFLDRRIIRRVDRVVCVSEGQAARVRASGVDSDRVTVIRNGIMAEGFGVSAPEYVESVARMFPAPPAMIVGSVGRLSPEKGFGVLVSAAAIVSRSRPEVGFVHFGDGPLRQTLAARIEREGLRDHFVLAGFRSDVNKYYPSFDLFVLPSFTEGLPTVVLESYASGVPVVATAVGGTPEAVADGVDGFLIPPGDPNALASRILQMLDLGEERKAMGRRGRDRIRIEFGFDVQATRYRRLFRDLGVGRSTAATLSTE